MQPEQTVVNNREKHQFEIQLGHEFGLLTYREQPGQIELVHTEVPPSQRGKRRSFSMRYRCHSSTTSPMNAGSSSVFPCRICRSVRDRPSVVQGNSSRWRRSAAPRN